ncbi:phage baseplate upper protein [Enterococcus faecium]|nr:phage baseplate upper protein [Enterococcus faecium]
MANLEIKLSANKRQPYLRHRVVGRVGDGGLTTINVQLLEEDEITPFVINLNGTLKFVGEVSNGNYTEGEPEIIDSTNGLISYTFTKSNFSTSHQFKQAYFEYVDPNGKKVTFQNFIIDVLERVDINSEQAKYYISSLEKLQSEMQTTFNQFISDKQVQYDQIYSKYNELVRLINESDKQVNNRIDQTNQQIGDLGKLKKMYSNSIDFGDYDYSENPNLMPYITEPWVGPLLGNGHTVKDSVKRVITHTKTRTANSGDILSLGLGIPCTAEANNRYLITTLRPSTTYTLSVTMSVGSDWTGETNTIGVRLRYLNEQGGIELPINALIPANVERDKMVTHTFTGITKDNVTSITNCYVEIFSLNSEYKGTVSVSYDVKLKAHYPNLLDGPYWLSKVPLGENIADPTVVFPHKTSEYMVYGRRNTENYIADQTYTISMKATKLTVQSFAVYIAAGRVKVGDMKPTEGLANTWELTFTVTKQHIDSGVTNYLEIYQYPSSTKGAVQIDWLKIEKGDTRTPNISQFKYFGEGLKDSNNPNDYSWDVTPEYTEKGLNDTVSLTEPQSIEGLKNFEDGIQSKGKSVLTSDDNKYEVVTLTVTNGNTGSAKLYREGKTVTIYFFALNGKSSGGNDSTILTIPEGYRPPISFEQLVGSIDRSTLNSAQLSIGADGAIKWRRNSSYGSDYTFAITYTI